MARLQPRPMEVQVEVLRPDSMVTISIVHEDYQSFSRAVHPRAVREFRKAVRGGLWDETAEYGLDLPEGGDPRRCLSRFVFTRSLDV